MSYLDLTEKERAALIERQRNGWRSSDVRDQRERDRLSAAARSRRRARRLKFLAVAINGDKEATG